MVTLPNGAQFSLVEVQPYGFWQITVPEGHTLPTQLQGLWTDSYQAWLLAVDVLGGANK